jgi:hypothetical protein
LYAENSKNELSLLTRCAGAGLPWRKSTHVPAITVANKQAVYTKQPWNYYFVYLSVFIRMFPACPWAYKALKTLPNIKNP